MILGAIGDDFTGSSDLGLMLASGGMQTVQYVGVPTHPSDSTVDAGIVALKSRSLPVQDAVRLSIDAYRWLKAQGCQQFLFKYCSTFDSTPQGNIGPVIDALLDEMGTDSPVIVCPAFPATGRTIFQGHLFVNDRLLSESGMENHPLTPMKDPDIRRVLASQTKHSVGHLPVQTIRLGDAKSAMDKLANAGTQLIVCDAIDGQDLIALANAAKNYPLITGGSGIAIGLPALYGKKPNEVELWRGESGPVLCISGSCSTTTLAQIQYHESSGAASRALDIEQAVAGTLDIDDLIHWASAQKTVPLIYSSAKPEQVATLQKRYGADKVAAELEHAFGQLASAAFEKGFKRIVSAGGETSGAVVEALAAHSLEIGPMIDPGVPALRVSGKELTIALKSGNFGAPNFFTKAARLLKG